MKSSRIALVLVALVAALLAAGCGGGGGVPEDAVAVVDGKPIARVELDTLIDRAKLSFEQQNREFPKAGSPEYQALQTQGVAYLVQRVEYELEADKMGIEVGAKELDKRIADVKKQYFGNDEKRFEKQLKEQGYTEDAFEDDLRAQILSEKIYDRVTGEVKVTDAQIEKYYAENKSQYEQPQSREVRHILVKTAKEANDVINRLKAGTDFAKLAKEKSLDPGSKETGGKYTVTRNGQFVKPFEDEAFRLETGEVSKPIKTEFGFHVIEALSAVKPAKTTPLARVKASIRKQLGDEKRNELIARWANDVKSDYEDKVEYGKGFEPPAEATQTGATTADK